MFRAIIIALSGAAALSAGAAQAGGSCGVKSGGHSHVQHHQPHYAQKVYVKPVYVKPVHVEPIYIEPVKYCVFKVYYKQPCWDYQKQLSFNNLGEAQQMAQMFYDNGFKVALLKYEGFTYDKPGYGKAGGPIGSGPVGSEIVGGKPLATGKVQGQVLFEGTGNIVKNQGPPTGDLTNGTPLFDKPQLLDKPQTLDIPLVLNGAE